MMVDRNAIFSDSTTASWMPGVANGCCQAAVENLCQVKLNRPGGSLKLNRITTAIGTSRYRNARPAKTFSSW